MSHPDPTTADRSVEDELRELRIEGHRIEFGQRVALLPVELVEESGGGEGRG